MLILDNDVIALIKKNNININGVLHIGAHECEEQSFYDKLGVERKNVIWIDANKKKVLEAQNRGIENVYYAVVSDEDDKTVTFNITNNGQSSSILDFGSHAHHHPHVHFIEKQTHQTITINTFYKNNMLELDKYDFWNFDIQGAELLALKGAKDILPYVKVLYMEVNTEEVYKGCGLITEIDSFLETYGLKRVLTNMTNCGWGDAVYIKAN
jgi:FkbM family methyltransferase